MGRLECELDPERFVRIHRSAIVQIDRIRELVSDFHGDFEVLLRGGTRLTLSRSYRAKVETALGREIRYQSSASCLGKKTGSGRARCEETFRLKAG
jgi:hypothetical protein